MNEQAVRPQDLGIGRLFGSIRDAVIVADAETGRIVLWNPAAEAIFGHAAAEAVGRNVSILVGGEHGAKHDGYLAAYRRTGVRKAVGHLRDLPGRRKDGSPVPLDLSIAEWRDAEGKRFFTGIMRDISARKADEARRALLMREVDHRAKNALAAVQAVVRLTPAAYLIEVSDQAASCPPTPAVDRDPSEGGLGLYLIAELATDHGWYVTAEAKHVWAVLR